jgi:hypothetical protein
LGRFPEERRENMLVKLGATEHRPARKTEIGYFGAVYALHRLGEEVLPEPVASPRGDYDSVKQAWKEMTEQYNTQLQALEAVRVERTGRNYSLDDLDHIT